MDSYKKMYYELFNSTAKVIQFLQEAQKKTEEMFMSADESDVSFSKGEESEDNPSMLKKSD